MPKSNFSSPRDEKVTAPKLPGAEKLYVFEDFPMLQTEEGFWRYLDTNSTASTVDLDNDKVVTVVQFHKYLKAQKSYVVMRFTIDMNSKQSSVSKLATFARQEWAREYINNGSVSCGGTCKHGKQCRQIRAPFNNSSPNLKYFFCYIGRGRIAVSKRVYDSVPKKNS